MKRLFLLTAVLALLVVGGSKAYAALSTFETFNTGSINGQSGWTVEDAWGYNLVESGKPNNLDEGIKDDGTGNKVWRISNAYAYSEYSSQPFSPTTDQVAGESDSSLWNDRGPDNTNPYSPLHFGANATTDRFYTSFDFRSATGAAQSGLAITLSPSAKQSSVRMSYLRILDTGNGFDLLFNGDYGTLTVASGLSYTDWHSIAMDVTFVDGAVNSGDSIWGNDIVKVYADGSLVHTGTTWESYYYDYERIVPTSPRLQAVDSMLYRVAGTAVPSTLGNGFYFDNIEVSNGSNAAVPEPMSVLLGIMGLSSVVGFRKLRRK